MAAESEARALYAVLGVPADATQDEIKHAYRRLALEHHPDRQQWTRAADSQRVVGEDEETFSRIVFAYEVLGNDQRRKRYDLTGELPQSDAALGRRAMDALVEVYMHDAPKVAKNRAVTEADMSLHRLDNYEILEVDGRDVPVYLRGIVAQGLAYLIAVVDGMEDKDVVLLRHFVMDQMYALLAYTPPLDDDAFAERGYIITYYDHPLQAGIKASWSDQNGFEHRKDGVRPEAVAHLKEIDPAVFEQRRLAALEWKGPSDLASSDGPTSAAHRSVPGSGRSPERLLLGVRAMLQASADLEGRTIHVLRRELEAILSLEPHSLDDLGATRLMAMILEASEEDRCEEIETDQDTICEAEQSPPQLGSNSCMPGSMEVGSLATGSRVRVLPSGRVGVVTVYDPSDTDLTFKVQFEGGEHDWFAQAMVVQA